MATYEEAPPLPRSPTIIRDMNPPTPFDSPHLQPLRTTPSKLPLPPPRFPSMKDVSADPPSTTSIPTDPTPPPPQQQPLDISWQRSANDSSFPSTAATLPTESTDDLDQKSRHNSTPDATTHDSATEAPTKKVSFVANLVAKVKALLVKGKKGDDSEEQPPKVAAETPVKKPAMVKVKELVCKMPDPTLLFIFEATVVLVLHLYKPDSLRTWLARILAPAILMATVVMTSLWRRTKMISVVENPEFVSKVTPIPNAAMIVSKGETLRSREVELVKREEEFRKGQMKLEVLRKEIQGRLPPQVSIANLLEIEERERVGG